MVVVVLATRFLSQSNIRESFANATKVLEASS